MYIRDGGKWKAGFHAAAPVVDPKDAYASLDNNSHSSRNANGKTADSDPRTDGLLSAEKAVWEAWREHDANKLGELMANDISFINIFGTYLASRADALKNWSGTGCDVKRVQISDAMGTMLSAKIGILTFRADADGTCYGQKIGGVRGSSIYVKSGDSWKWTFGINLPAPASTSALPTGN